MNSQSENIFFLISEETFAVSPGISWVYKGRWYDLNIYSFFPSKLYWLYAWLYVYDFTIGSSREAERNVGYELEQFKKIIPTIESPPFFSLKRISRLVPFERKGMRMKKSSVKRRGSFKTTKRKDFIDGTSLALVYPKRISVRNLREEDISRKTIPGMKREWCKQWEKLQNKWNDYI